MLRFQAKTIVTKTLTSFKTLYIKNLIIRLTPTIFVMLFDTLNGSFLLNLSPRKWDEVLKFAFDCKEKLH